MKKVEDIFENMQKTFKEIKSEIDNNEKDRTEVRLTLDDARAIQTLFQRYTMLETTFSMILTLFEMKYKFKKGSIKLINPGFISGISLEEINEDTDEEKIDKEKK